MWIERTLKAIVKLLGKVDEAAYAIIRTYLKAILKLQGKYLNQ